MLTMVGVLLLCSCTDTVFHEYHDLDSDGWAVDDTVTFSLPKITRSGRLQGELGVRAGRDYPFNTLPLCATVERDGEQLSTDTVVISLYRSSGEPTARGILPYAVVTQKLPVLHVDSGHVYAIHVTHLVDSDRVEGIMSVGAKLSINN